MSGRAGGEGATSAGQAPRAQGAGADGPAADPLNRRSLALSLAIHAAALVVLIWGVPVLARDPVAYQAIEIRVVSAPPAPAPPPPEDAPPPAPPEELVVETVEEAVDEEEAVVPVEEEAPPPEPQETAPPEVEDDDPPPPEEEPVPAAADESEQEDGGEDINVRLEGLKRDYPAYYDNIIRQIERCFRPPGGGDRLAVVEFMVHQDGSVSGIDVAERSGSFIFDLAAQEAIECAGRPGRMGPLPEGYTWDVLPVQFRFRPGSEATC